MLAEKQPAGVLTAGRRGGYTRRRGRASRRDSCTADHASQVRLPIPAASLSRPQLSPLPRASLLVLASTLGLAIILVTYWPGWVSPDSIYQLQQARSGVFTDWHPPLMAWVWRWLDLAWPGPQGMLVLQNALFWGGLALACGIWIQSAVGAAVVLLIGLSPACFSNLGTVWKDIQMGAALLAAFALLSKYRMDKNRVALGGSALCLCYACAVRHNGLPKAGSGFIALPEPDRLPAPPPALSEAPRWPGWSQPLSVPSRHRSQFAPTGLFPLAREPPADAAARARQR